MSTEKNIGAPVNPVSGAGDPLKPEIRAVRPRISEKEKNSVVAFHHRVQQLMTVTDIDIHTSGSSWRELLYEYSTRYSVEGFSADGIPFAT